MKDIVHISTDTICDSISNRDEEYDWALHAQPEARAAGATIPWDTILRHRLQHSLGLVDLLRLEAWLWDKWQTHKDAGADFRDQAAQHRKDVEHVEACMELAQYNEGMAEGAGFAMDEVELLIKRTREKEAARG